MSGKAVTPRQAAAGITAINILGIAGGFLGPSLMGYLRDLTGSWQCGTLLIALFGLACIFIVLTLHTHLRQTAARQFSADASPLL